MFEVDVKNVTEGRGEGDQLGFGVLIVCLPKNFLPTVPSGCNVGLQMDFLSSLFLSFTSITQFVCPSHLWTMSLH